MKNEEFRKAVDAAFKKNAKYFKVPGFRNGKVPRAVVEKMYGEECLYESVIEDNVDKKYYLKTETYSAVEIDSMFTNITTQQKIIQQLLDIEEIVAANDELGD